MKAVVTGNTIFRWRTFGPVLLGLFVLAGTACEALTAEGALAVVDAGREVRTIEDVEVAPLEHELQKLYNEEIQPREAELETLRSQEQEIQDTVIRPLYESQNDPWGPGGEASQAQQDYDARFQEIDRQYREIDLEERDLQARFQGPPPDPSQSPEVQAKEDERYETQRELDRLYRYGWDPIQDVYDEIDRLSNPQNTVDADVSAQVEDLQHKIDALYEQANQLDQDAGNEASDVSRKLDRVNNELDALYNHGRNQIDDLYRQIEDEQVRLSESGAGFFAVQDEKANLESQVEFLEAERDRNVAGLVDARDAVVAEQDDALAEIDAQIAAVEAELDALFNDPVDTAPEPDPAVVAAIEALHAEREVESGAVTAIETDASSKADAIAAEKDAVIAPIEEKIAVLEVELSQVDDGTASSTDAVLALKAQIDDLAAAVQAEVDAAQVAIAEVEVERDAAIEPHVGRIDEIDAEIAALEAALAETEPVSTGPDPEAVASLEAELDDLRTARDQEAGGFATWVADLEDSIHEETRFWTEQVDGVLDELAALQDGPADPVDVDDSYLNSLIEQVNDMEYEYESKVVRLEDRRAELESKLNSLYSEDTTQYIYEEIDRLNGLIFQLTEASGSVSDENNRRIEELQITASEMEQDLQDRTRALEERVWNLDDQLQEFYHDSEVNQRDWQAEMGDAFQALQQRRYELDDQRYAVEAEMNDYFNSFDNGHQDVEQKVRKIETELLTPVRARMRELEAELRDLHARAGDLEHRVRAAQQAVEQKQRDVEDQVLDLIETAANAAAGPGTVDFPVIEGNATIVDAPSTAPEPVDPVADEAPVTVGVGE